MLKAVLFDFDGVIARSEELHMKTFLDLLEPYDIEVSKKRWWTEFSGTGSRHIFNVLVKENNLPEDPANLVEKRKKIYQDEVMKGGLKEVEGIKEFLQALHAKGIKTAVVSGSHRANVLTAIEILDLPKFDAIVCGDDLLDRKPSPVPFLHAVKLLAVKPEECVAFEDSLSGMISVKAANLPLICVYAHPDLDQSRCDLKIKDYLKLKITDLERLLA